MEQVLLVIHVIIAASLIGMVLLQRSDTDGFGLGGGSSNNLLSGRATANLLTRITQVLAGLFLVSSLILSILAAHHTNGSVLDTLDKEQAEAAAPAIPAKEADQAIDKKAAKNATEKKTAPAVPTAGETVKSGETTAARNNAAEEDDSNDD